MDGGCEHLYLVGTFGCEHLSRCTFATLFGAAGKDHSLAVLDLSCHAVLHSDAFILDSATGEADLQDFGLWRLYACAVIALLV